MSSNAAAGAQLPHSGGDKQAASTVGKDHSSQMRLCVFLIPSIMNCLALMLHGCHFRIRVRKRFNEELCGCSFLYLFSLRPISTVCFMSDGESLTGSDLGFWSWHWQISALILLNNMLTSLLSLVYHLSLQQRQNSCSAVLKMKSSLKSLCEGSGKL